MKYTFIALFILSCAKMESQAPVSQSANAAPSQNFTQDPPMGPGLPGDGWVSGQIYVRNDNSKYPIAIRNYSEEPDYPTGYGDKSGEWVDVDVTQLGLPADTKSVFLSGILIISHGTNNVDCNLTVTFRAPGNDLQALHYAAQAIEPFISGGQRSTMSQWVPVINGKFEYQWNRNTFEAWPMGCSYGINLSLQAFVR